MNFAVILYADHLVKQPKEPKQVFGLGLNCYLNKVLFKKKCKDRNPSVETAHMMLLKIEGDFLVAEANYAD